MQLTIRPMGQTALLVETDGIPAVLAIDAALRSASAQGRLPPMVDQVPAARTVLLRPGPGTALNVLRRQIDNVCAAIDSADPGIDDEPPLVIPVSYHGPDLADVAGLTGLSTGEVVNAHTGSQWRVAFGGFAPGFGYLVGGDPRLRVPRRSEPRTSIPAGAVGLAGEFSGVYPRSSPGGWQLIGRTDMAIWDVERDPPALLRPGRRVRFQAVDHA